MRNEGKSTMHRHFPVSSLYVVRIFVVFNVYSNPCLPANIISRLIRWMDLMRDDHCSPESTNATQNSHTSPLRYFSVNFTVILAGFSVQYQLVDTSSHSRGLCHTSVRGDVRTGSSAQRVHRFIVENATLLPTKINFCYLSPILEQWTDHSHLDPAM